MLDFNVCINHVKIAVQEMASVVNTFEENHKFLFLLHNIEQKTGVKVVCTTFFNNNGFQYFKRLFIWLSITF